MAEPSDYLLKLKQEKPLLFGRVCFFNFWPAAYAHPSFWPDALSKSTLELLLKSSRGLGRLSDWLLEKNHIQDTFAQDFQKSCYRIALLEPGIVQQLFLKAGAGLCHERIGQVVQKEQRQAIEHQLGEGVYIFAIKQAPLMLGRRPRLPILENPTEDLLSDVLMAAQQCFQACFAGAEKALVERFRYKLPAAIDWDFASMKDPNLSETVWPFLRRLLNQDKSESTSICFE